MLKPHIQILDFDGSLAKQQNLLFKYSHSIIPLRDLAPKARLWMNRRTRDIIQARLRGISCNCVTFLGSGDFHHISELLLNQCNFPLSLIVFDLHPDWDTLPPRLACGSWVNQALKRKNILKVILIGVSSDDLSWPWIQSGNLNALKGDRLEIYPYAHNPSPVFLKKIPGDISLRTKKGFLCNRIYWNELKDKNLEDFFLSMVKRLPAKNVYVSIDKDCLRGEYALTNWEEGRLTLDELIMMLKAIKENLDISGLDITGDYSTVYAGRGLKNFFSRLDHPRRVMAEGFPDESVTRLNEETNLKILEALFT